jgi:predicted dehydrogenase
MRPLAHQTLSRRAALGAALLPAADLLAQQRSNEMPPEWPRFGRKIRVGMVGLEGHPGLVYDVVARHPDLELVAIARDTVPVDGLRRRPKFRDTAVYDDYQSMFAKEQFDVVGVCNTNGHRAEVIVEAAKRGWHIAAEKPVAMSQKELDSVRRAVSRPGLGFTSLLPMRYEPALYTMGMMVREGAVGEVLMMNGQKSYQLGSRAEWFKDPKLYGSTMLWIGVHQLDLMHWISTKRFASVYSYEQNVGAPEFGSMENVTGAVLHLENGGVATLNMDYLRPNAAGSHGDDRLRVAGTKGILEYRYADGLSYLQEGRKEVQRPELRKPKLPLFVEFLSSIYLGGSTLIQPNEIFHVVSTLNAARTSDEKAIRVDVRS